MNDLKHEFTIINNPKIVFFVQFFTHAYGHVCALMPVVYFKISIRILQLNELDARDYNKTGVKRSKTKRGRIDEDP